MQTKTASVAGGLETFFMTEDLLAWSQQVKAERWQLSDNVISI